MVRGQGKAVVLFPGVRYSCDTPLLYYAAVTFAQRGYEVLRVDYGSDLRSTEGLDATAAALEPIVLSQLQNWQLEQYEDVVFVSKSIGTVLAGRCGTRLPCCVRHIYLTPLEQTLPFLTQGCGVALGAGEDPFLDAQRLRAHCAENKVPLKLFPGVAHRLEDKKDIQRTLDIMKEVVTLYEQF